MKATTGFVPVSVLLFLLIQCGYAETRVREEGRLPLYIRKARELLLRQKAYQTTQDRRMEILSKALSSFAGDLYSHHVNGNQGNGSFGNVLISPMGAFASLAMMLTASRGATKREVAAALALDDITGVHHTLQRAFTSYRRDDSHEIDNDVSDGAWDDAGKGEYTGPSHDDLEDIMRNDYIIDNSISYSAGQTNLMFSDGSIASAHSHSPQRQMNTADDDLQDTIAIRFANGMFHNEDVGLSQRFIMRLASLYGVPPMAMQQSDPEDSVNLWVDAATYGAISRVLESGSLDEDTSLVLISATYFRAGWQERFNEKLLSVPFQTGFGDTVEADFLHHVGNYSLKTSEQLAARVLEIPYVGGRYSLFVVLPNTYDAETGLPDLEQRLEEVDMQALLHDMPQASKTLVMIPKFSLHTRLSLREALQALGAKRMFQKGKADLGRITDEVKNRLFVNDVIQRVTLHVDDGKPRDDVDDSVRVGVTDDETVFGPESDKGTGETDKDGENDESDHYHLLYPTADDDLDEYEGDYDYGEDYDTVYESGDVQGDFIVDRPFFFLVKDNQFDLILLLGRVTNPLP